MKSNLDSDTTPAQKYKAFQQGLQQSLQVSKADMNRMLEEEKIANQGKVKRGPKPKASGPASSETD